MFGPRIQQYARRIAEVIVSPLAAIGMTPNMATMLSFIMTDAEMSYPDLTEALRYAVHRSFNSISVDGDTSTNDMVVVLANGASGIRPPAADFRDKLTEDGADALVRILDKMEEHGQKAVLEVAEGRFERRLADVKAELIKWMFIFWVGQIGAMTGILFAFFRK